MQFFHLLLLCSAAAATAVPVPADSQCSTGSLQCCKSVSSAKDQALSLLLGLLGIINQDLNIPIGLNCSPISVVSSNNQCSGEKVCCENDSFNGIVAVGCTPA